MGEILNEQPEKHPRTPEGACEKAFGEAREKQFKSNLHKFIGEDTEDNTKYIRVLVNEAPYNLKIKTPLVGNFFEDKVLFWVEKLSKLRVDAGLQETEEPLMIPSQDPYNFYTYNSMGDAIIIDALESHMLVEQLFRGSPMWLRELK